MNPSTDGACLRYQASNRAIPDLININLFLYCQETEIKAAERGQSVRLSFSAKGCPKSIHLSPFLDCLSSAPFLNQEFTMLRMPAGESIDRTSRLNTPL